MRRIIIRRATEVQFFGDVKPSPPQLTEAEVEEIRSLAVKGRPPSARYRLDKNDIMHTMDREYVCEDELYVWAAVVDRMLDNKHALTKAEYRFAEATYAKLMSGRPISHERALAVERLEAVMYERMRR